jgi:hypothetical protein
MAPGVGKADQAGPPIGGASLECLLSYEAQLDLDDAGNFARTISARHFSLVAQDPFYADDGKPFSYPIPKLQTVDEFLSWVSGKPHATLIVNFHGNLFDTPARLSLLLDLRNNVVVVSTAEDMLWAFGKDVHRADKRRLIAFLDICKAIAGAKVPAFAHVGTESAHRDEIKADRASAEGFQAFEAKEFFSQVRVDELFDWYVSTYAHRWDNSISIKR